MPKRKTIKKKATNLTLERGVLAMARVIMRKIRCSNLSVFIEWLIRTEYEKRFGMLSLSKESDRRLAAANSDPRATDREEASREAVDVIAEAAREEAKAKPSGAKRKPQPPAVPPPESPIPRQPLE